MSHVGERPWWPIQSPNNGRKKKVKANMILDLQESTLKKLKKEEESKTLNKIDDSINSNDNCHCTRNEK